MELDGADELAGAVDPVLPEGVGTGADGEGDDGVGDAVLLEGVGTGADGEGDCGAGGGAGEEVLGALEDEGMGTLVVPGVRLQSSTSFTAGPPELSVVGVRVITQVCVKGPSGVLMTLTVVTVFD